MSDDEPVMVDGPCLGGPLDGGRISIGAPRGGSVGAAAVIVILNDKRYVYRLEPIEQFPHSGYRYDPNS